MQPPGVDVWSSKLRSNGYRLTRFWWTAVLSEWQFSYEGKPPTDVRSSDDGTTMLVSHGKTWYGATRIRIEGPAGLPPF